MLRCWACLLVTLLLGACATGGPATTGSAPCMQVGLASWYWPGLHRTADGDRDASASLIAAHRSLPFGTLVRVTDLDTGRSVTVRIDDRGPFVSGRIIDLSPAAATRLGMRQDGVAEVRLNIPRAQRAGGACPFGVSGRA